MNKSTRYSPEVRERAVRLVFEHQGEHASQWAALISIASKIAFMDQRDVALPECFEPIALNDSEISDWMHSMATEFEIDGDTCVPHWYAGDRMDWDLGMAHLFACTDKGEAEASNELLQAPLPIV